MRLFALLVGVRIPPRDGTRESIEARRDAHITAAIRWLAVAFVGQLVFVAAWAHEVFG